MTDLSKRHLSNRDFDWKTFYAFSIFSFTVTVNPRDFPINNIPLIYPAFLYLWFVFGPQTVREGFQRTRFLWTLLIIYWSYYRMLILFNGGSIGLGHLAYLLEPVLIVGAAGTVTVRPGGTKAAMWAFVSMITLSTILGLWIIFIGEPVTTWHTTVHSHVYGNLLTGDTVKNNLQDIAALLFINTGFSYYIFMFSYQLAAAGLITLASMLYARPLFKTKTILLWGTFVILLSGVITNTERATLLSVSIGLLAFLALRRRKTLNLGTIFTIAIIFMIGNNLLTMTSIWGDKNTLMKRTMFKEKTQIRLIDVPLAAVGSILYEPLGAGGMSDHYIKAAYDLKWVDSSGNFVSPHNHFSNTIMYTGIVGVFLTISLLTGLFRKTKYIRLAGSGNNNILLAAACIALSVHSLTHNTGFFAYEASTLIFFGLLWGATTTLRKPRSRLMGEIKILEMQRKTES